MLFLPGFRRFRVWQNAPKSNLISGAGTTPETLAVRYPRLGAAGSVGSAGFGAAVRG